MSKYVGLRYVPVFAGEWVNTKVYEPLMIVSYQGASYTSKTYVPLGVDILNTKYWECTGNYNAQVELYREEVLDMKNQVPVNIKKYSALVVDNDWTAAVEAAALDTSVKQLFIPSGTYELKSPRVYRGDFEIYGEGDGTILKFKNGATKSLRMDVPNVQACIAFMGSLTAPIKNIKVHNIMFLGLVEQDGFIQQNHLLYAAGVDGLDIFNCTFYGHQGDAINIAMQSETEIIHNYNVRIINNHIDGVTKQNRNGITISDGTKVLIANNVIENCSKAGMPGHIDIEAELPSTIFNNISVINNICNGDEGDGFDAVIGVAINQNLTVQAKGFLISGNIIMNCNRNGIGVLQYGSDTVYANKEVQIVNNYFDGVRFLRFDNGINGALISGNIAKQTLSSWIGQINPDKKRTSNLIISDNRIECIGTNHALDIGYGENVQVKGNIFNNCQGQCMIVGSYDYQNSISDFSIINNTFNGVDASTYAVNCPINSVTDSKNNRYEGNNGTATITNFSAIYSDYKGINGYTLNGYTGATLPNDLPVGTSSVLLSGDLTVPGEHGLLTTYKYSSIEGNVTQTHLVNGELYIRSASANTWSAFKKVTTEPIA